MTMKMQSASITIPGIGKINEDASDFQKLGGRCIAVVADGVGGNYGGSVASALAVKSVFECFETNPKSKINEVFSYASQNVKKTGNADLISNQMATTLSVCVLDQDGIGYVGHVGDSRIYHLRGNGIIQRTKDQTEVAALVEAGILSREQAKSYPRRTVLRSALSAKGGYDLFEFSFSTVSGDRLLLVTDGVYRVLSKTQLRDISTSSQTLSDFASKLHYELAGKNDDDATAVLIEIE